MTQEIWKNVVGYEGKYQVSNLGRVKSFSNSKTRKEKILKPSTISDGYIGIIICKNGKRKMFLVHRLVAQAFIPNPNNYYCVNHKDEDKTNNRVENLEWCTYRYNLNYGTRNKRASKTMTNGKTSKAVLQYNKEGGFIREYPSVNEVERQFRYSRGNISSCCNGERKSAYGYVWKYA